MNLEELLAKAQELNEKEEHQSVIDLLTDDVLKEHNNVDLTNEKAEAYYGLGYDYSEDKSYTKAVEAFEKTIELNPNASNAYNGLGNAYRELKQYDKAIEAYNKAIQIDPTLAYPYNGLGNSYDNLKQHEKAIEVYNKAIQIDPNYAFPYNGLGNAYKNLKQYEKAIEAYNKAIKIDPDLAYPYNGLGNAYRELKQYEKAIEAYNKAIKIDPDFAYPYNGLGNAYKNLKQYEKAIEAYNNAIKIDPDFAHPYNGLGNSYYNLKQYDKAIEAYNNAIKIDPDYPGTYYNIAQLYYDNKDYSNAVTNFQIKVRLEDNPNEYFTKLAKAKLEDIEQLLKNEELVTIKETIESIIDDIKEILSFKEEKVTHYTGISATKAMVLDASLFRLSEGNFLNDTSEGRELFKFLKFEVSTKHNDTVALPFTEKPFIGSFVPETKHNDLTLWRMYGKEGKDEACGCAITIDREPFLSAIKNSLTGNLDGNASTNLDDQFSFYRVAYILEDTNGNSKFIIPGTGKGVRKLKKIMNSLQEQIKLFNNPDVSKELDDIQYITELLNDIAYLFKSAEYQYEHELRLVVNGTGFKKKVDQNFTPPRVYIELCNINPVITKITLGPKVTLSDEWATSFNYSLDERGYNPDILLSRLPYK